MIQKTLCHKHTSPNSTLDCPGIYQPPNPSLNISKDISSVLWKAFQATVEYANMLNVEMLPLEFAKCFSCDLKELM